MTTIKPIESVIRHPSERALAYAAEKRIGRRVDAIERQAQEREEARTIARVAFGRRVNFPSTQAD